MRLRNPHPHSQRPRGTSLAALAMASSGGVGDGVQYAVHAHVRRHAAINRHRLERRQAEVIVRVHESGQQRSPVQAHHPSIRAGKLRNLRAGSHSPQPAVPHGHRLRPAVSPIHRKHVAPRQHQVHTAPPIISNVIPSAVEESTAPVRGYPLTLPAVRCHILAPCRPRPPLAARACRGRFATRPPASPQSPLP